MPDAMSGISGRMRSSDGTCISATPTSSPECAEAVQRANATISHAVAVSGALREHTEAMNKLLNGKLDGEAAVQAGTPSLIAGSADTTLCLMCAEKEPLDCHRTVLVSRRLAERGAAIEHLLADGKHKPHAVLEEELLEAGEGGAPDLFTSAEDRSQRLARAWQKRERAMKRA